MKVEGLTLFYVIDNKLGRSSRTPGNDKVEIVSLVPGTTFCEGTHKVTTTFEF